MPFFHRIKIKNSRNKRGCKMSRRGQSMEGDSDNRSSPIVLCKSGTFCPLNWKWRLRLSHSKTDWMSLLWTETRAKNEKKTKKTDLIYKDRDLRISDRVKLRNKRICYWRWIFIPEVDVWTFWHWNYRHLAFSWPVKSKLKLKLKHRLRDFWSRATTIWLSF